MHNQSLLHWLAAIGLAQMADVRIRWVRGRAEYEQDPIPAAMRMQWLSSARRRNHDKIWQPIARRAPHEGVARARAWLAEQPQPVMREQLDALLGDLNTRLVSARTTAAWETWGIGTLYPACIGGTMAVSPWLPALAWESPVRLQEIRYSWWPTMHPDTMGGFSAWECAEWGSAQRSAYPMEHDEGIAVRYTRRRIISDNTMEWVPHT